NFYDGPMIDLYRVLEIRRTATSSSIRSAYKKLSRSNHPDRFVDELRWDPEGMTVGELKGYAGENDVGVATLTDKRELVEVAKQIYRRTGEPDRALRDKIDEVNETFQIINLAHETLGDEERRRYYDLTGDWGEEIVFVPSREGGRADMGDRDEAERVRDRGRKSQMDDVQRRVYEGYLKEEREREEKEKGIREEGERVRRMKRERTEEETRREREGREVRQEMVKEKWGNLFKGVFGGD
ncbi:hypothetical protein TrRE_jg8567, partial [Triparma retinervis]